MMANVSKLALGASQFRYDGADAPRGRAPDVEIADILALAARAGIGRLDTAVSFGFQESMLGQAPGLDQFSLMVRAARADKGADFVETEARASLARLGVTRAEAIVVQNASELLGRNGPALWDKLEDLKDQGLFDKIGVVALASDDPVGMAKRFHPDLIQVPASLLDQRLIANGALSQIAEMGVEIHLRSVFLQGLLFLPPDRMPAQLQGAASSLSRVRRMIAEGRSDPLQAALGFALSRPEASAVVVNATTAQELNAMIAAAASPPPELDWENMAINDQAALNHAAA
jgi:aryl-alcohol dehydrogenase-like predicted oxidoreductase